MALTGLGPRSSSLASSFPRRRRIRCPAQAFTRLPLTSAAALQVADLVTAIAPTLRALPLVTETSRRPTTLQLLLTPAECSGKLRFEEFVHTILTQPTPGTSSEEEIAAIYDLFSQQGVVTATSVQAAMEALSQPVPPQRTPAAHHSTHDSVWALGQVSALLATDIVREADLDEDGVVSRDDFSQAALQ